MEGPGKEVVVTYSTLSPGRTEEGTYFYLLKPTSCLSLRQIVMLVKRSGAREYSRRTAAMCGHTPCMPMEQVQCTCSILPSAITALI